MPYPINIVVNNRIWYDSRILDSDPVVFQNVNYATGDERSVNIVRQRFMQDWARRTIPNSVRQGIGLSIDANEIDVTQGYAIVGGRFLDIPLGTYNADTEGLTGSGGSPIDHYFMIRVTPELEGDSRDTTLEEAALVAVIKASYDSAKSHDDLVLAKFRYNGSVIDQFVDYTAEQEWQANVISPPATRPGLTTATTENVLLRAGALQRVNIMNIETDKARFYLNAVFDDQTANTEVKLINNDGILETRDITDTSYLGQDMLNLLIGGSPYIDSSGNQSNVGTINDHTIQGGVDTFVMLATADTLSNKTLTTDTVITQINTDTIAGDDILIFPSLASTTDYLVSRTSTDTLTNKILTTARLNTPQFNEAIDMTATSTELNQLDGVEVGGIVTGDIVDLDTAQTLENKTLGSLMFWDADDSNFATITIPNLTGNKTYLIPMDDTATFMMEEFDNVITSAGSISFTSDNTFLLSAGQWTGAQHDHTAVDDGGILSITSATTGTLTVGKGGTGVVDPTDHAIYVGSGNSAMSSIGVGTNGQIMTGISSSDPIWRTLTATRSGGHVAFSGSFSSSGVLTLTGTVDNNSHTHDDRYYTESAMDTYLGMTSGNAFWVPLSIEAGSETLNATNTAEIEWGAGTTGFVTYKMTVPMHYDGVARDTIVIKSIRVRAAGDNANYITATSYSYISSTTRTTSSISATDIGKSGAQELVFSSSPLPLTLATTVDSFSIILTIAADFAGALSFYGVEAEVYYT